MAQNVQPPKKAGPGIWLRRSIVTRTPHYVFVHLTGQSYERFGPFKLFSRLVQVGEQVTLQGVRPDLPDQELVEEAMRQSGRAWRRF